MFFPLSKEYMKVFPNMHHFVSVAILPVRLISRQKLEIKFESQIHGQLVKANGGVSYLCPLF
jgi:hypothetical protein